MILNIELKQACHKTCETLIAERISTARSSMEEAQKAANEEVKSSAGDKYETGRAMLQIERDKHALQLSEALQLKAILDQLNPKQTQTTVTTGTLVSCSMGYFYISVSAGKMQVMGKTIFAISIASPLGQALKGKEAGDQFSFNGKTIQVTDVL
ncbi:3-oxoacyl-ACP synthase [Algivirga pacifica]|uniref:3-oxoacyl-ACP synthase n=1 Tax=Algivirga pacifica TaxID=1162670 RepID=A0ABP9D6Z5_9BACT